MTLTYIQAVCILVVDLTLRPDLISLTPSSDHPTVIQYSSFVLSIVTLVLGLVGNTIVIIITGFLMKTHKSRIWFLNLAIADLMFLLILPLNAVSEFRANWSHGQHGCKMYNFLSIGNMFASIFLITAMTFERFLSVMAPIWHHKFYSPRVCYCTCAAIWAVTVLSSIPAIVFSNVFAHSGTPICNLFPTVVNMSVVIQGYEIAFEPVFQLAGPNVSTEELLEELHKACVTGMRDFDKESETIHNLLLTANYFLFLLLTFSYFIPLFVILCCNVAIACKVRASGTIRSSKLYGMVTAAIMAFFITRTPFVIAQIIIFVCLQNINLMLMTKVKSMSPLLSSIANLNCCLNPFIYVFLGREVMNVFSDFFNRIRYRKTNVSSVPVTSK